MPNVTVVSLEGSRYYQAILYIAVVSPRVFLCPSVSQWVSLMSQ